MQQLLRISRSFRRSAVLALWLLVAVLLSPFPPAQHPRPAAPAGSRLQRRIRAILEAKEARQALWGLEVVSVRTGRRLVAFNPDKLFTPASTAKLFTVAAALLRLGPDFTYQTTVETAAPLDNDGRLPGDLVLVGRGDPNLSGRILPYQGRTERSESPAKVFEELAEQVAQKGVRVVEGDLVVDDTYFVFQPYGQGWSMDDLQWWYGAPVSALAFNDNVVFIHIQPGNSVGQPAQVRLEPEQSRYAVENRVVTVPRQREAPGGATRTLERRFTIDRQPGSAVVRLWGEIPEGSAESGEALAMDDPPRAAGEALLQELTRRGVEVKGKVQVRRQYPAEAANLREAPAPIPSAAPTVLASRQSLPLAESLKVILKVSHNLHAEMLLRTLGRQRRNVGSVQAGLEEVGEFLKEIGLEEGNVALRDGSGLSRQSLVTPSAMVALLRYLYNSPQRGLWMDLLPMAGTDGSLTERLRGRTTTGRVQAKTGTLTGVAALAGYAPNRRNELFAFALFVNHHTLPNAEAGALLDRIVEEIAASR